MKKICKNFCVLMIAVVAVWLVGCGRKGEPIYRSDMISVMLTIDASAIVAGEVLAPEFFHEYMFSKVEPDPHWVGPDYFGGRRIFTLWLSEPSMENALYAIDLMNRNSDIHFASLVRYDNLVDLGEV